MYPKSFVISLLLVPSFFLSIQAVSKEFTHRDLWTRLTLEYPCESAIALFALRINWNYILVEILFKFQIILDQDHLLQVVELQSEMVKWLDFDRYLSDNQKIEELCCLYFFNHKMPQSIWKFVNDYWYVAPFCLWK